MNTQILTPQLVAEWLRPRPDDSHKGDYGRALLVAGSRGMMGAALLSARACMRSGVGLLTVRVPACGYDILQLGIPEAKCDCDPHPDHHTQIFIPSGTEVLGIGPGLGQDLHTQQALHELLLSFRSLSICATADPRSEQVAAPIHGLVLDADALNILALHSDWLPLLPPGTILTPHTGEMQRLGGNPLLLAERYHLVVVLKGHHTQVFFPKSQIISGQTGPVQVNDQEEICSIVNKLHGNPGMAVGGSGDVLTGIILALLAQHYSPVQAASLGVWLHAFAADLALADGNSVESLLPSDIIAHLGAAFNISTTKY